MACHGMARHVARHSQYTSERPADASSFTRHVTTESRRAASVFAPTWRAPSRYPAKEKAASPPTAAPATTITDLDDRPKVDDATDAAVVENDADGGSGGDGGGGGGDDAPPGRALGGGGLDNAAPGGIGA